MGRQLIGLGFGAFDTTFPPAGGWPSNEPEGYVTQFHADGTSKADMGSHTTNPNVVVVEDLDAPNGSALEFRYPLGDDEGFSSAFVPSTSQLSEVYYRLLFRLHPNWDHHEGGDKCMYMGHVGKSTSYFLMLGGPAGGPYNMGWQSQPPDNSSAFWRCWEEGGENVDWVTHDEYHLVEVQMIAQSAANVADGIWRCWINGDLKTQHLDRNYVNTGSVNFQGCQFNPYWGGSGRVGGKIVDPYDWWRYGEFKMSGVVAA